MSLKMMKKIASLRNGLFLLAASLTLGLAPFTPEPHIVANLRWIAGGAVGMTGANYGDTLMHGMPWLLLMSWGIVWLIVFVKEKRSKGK
jgi:hypothetical protein